MNLPEERLPGFWNISPTPRNNFENQLVKEFLESNENLKKKSQNPKILSDQYNLLKEIWMLKNKAFGFIWKIWKIMST